MHETARAFGYAALVGWHDMRRQYTWWTWVASWLQRCIFQVTFFALIGTLLGSRAVIEYMLVGNAVLIGASTAAFAIQNSAWERSTGTLPLLVASPARPLIAFLGRSSQNIPSAIVSSLVTFVVVALMFDVSIEPRRFAAAIPVVVLVVLTTYVTAACFGGIAVRWPTTRNLVANVFQSSMLVLCGVNYPVSAMPDAAQAVANALPLTHGLEAVRLIIDGSSVAAIGREASLEAAVGAAWLLLAFLTFDRLVERGRADGSIEFGS